ncbi:MAG: cbb3-type cytochrome c oxidase subunit 3 [Turneriella sp.]|nr:cbb3-type cytochrome c oxidase subunit 3 [Turneriella sp.]
MLARVLSDITGIAVYPVVSLLVFFTIFAAILFHVLRRNKAHDERMAQLPLEDDVTNRGGSNNGAAG